MEKVKKISKYVVNGLNMINMLLLGLAEIWNWNIDKISATIMAKIKKMEKTTISLVSTEIDTEKGED